MTEEMISKIQEHYTHAKDKHPYFCDKLSYFTKYGATNNLQSTRRELEFNIENISVSFKNVLNCEIAEAEKEIVYGNTDAAVEECYDAIAVLLRTIDVLEGRQELGNPEKDGARVWCVKRPLHHCVDCEMCPPKEGGVK